MGASGDLQWALDLVDKVSGPAERAASSLERLEKHFEKTEKAAKETTSTFDKLGQVAKLAAGAFASIKVLEFAHTVTEARRFKEETIIALRAMGETRVEAAEAWRQTQDLAFRTGTDFHSMMELSRDMLGAGRSLGDIRLLQQAVADIGVLKGAAAMPALISAMGTLGDSARFTTRTMMQLRAAGVSQEDVLKSLATRYHLTTAEVEKFLEKGKFGKTAGFQAIIDAVSGMSKGGLGSAAAMAADTVSHLVTSIKEEFVALFTEGDAESFGGMLKRPLMIIRDMLLPGSPFLKGVQAGLAELAAGFGLVGSDGKSGLEVFLLGLKDGTKLGPEFRQTMREVGETLRDVVGLLGDLGKGLHYVAAGIQELKSPGSRAERILNTPGVELTPAALAEMKLRQAAPAESLEDALQGGIVNESKRVSMIPKMAEGGLVTSPTLALVGEAGPEAVVPLDQLRGLAGGGHQVNVTIHAHGSSEEQARALGDKTSEAVLAALSSLFEKLAIEQGVS